jgi:hypothetical protein
MSCHAGRQVVWLGSTNDHNLTTHGYTQNAILQLGNRSHAVPNPVISAMRTDFTEIFTLFPLSPFTRQWLHEKFSRTQVIAHAEQGPSSLYQVKRA